MWQPLVSIYTNPHPIDWVQNFGTDAPLVVEIGSGLGEYLVESANKDSSRNYIGIECDPKRVHKILKRINPGKHKNIRVFQSDAKLVFLRFLSPRSVHQIHSLFPCPWPKRRHEKYRLFSSSFLQLLNSRLVDQGRIRIVTDYDPYARWIESQVARTGFRFEIRKIDPQFNTKFEKKWLSLGHRQFFEMLLFKVSHVDVPVLGDVAVKEFLLKEFKPDLFRPQYYKGEEGSVVFKDFAFDSQQQKGFVHALVVEAQLSQEIWFMIVKKSKSWIISVLSGLPFIPTKGVSKALELVNEYALATTSDGPGLSQ